ncbi:MAG: hypothetical protein LBH25_14760 [Fibromonadaceae bacterium]|jgi:Sec-independent protein translocase protein TatA|nr:hypothetical protein [Fibromonadaceae bacterium]
MISGIGVSEILLILAIMVIFVKPKDIPELMRRAFKLVGQLRSTIKKFIDELDVK